MKSDLNLNECLKLHDTVSFYDTFLQRKFSNSRNHSKMKEEGRFEEANKSDNEDDPAKASFGPQ